MSRYGPPMELLLLLAGVALGMALDQILQTL